MQLKRGQVVDRYVVQGILGQGGIAVVYRVEHSQLGSQHAMKVLSLTSTSVASRLLAEGRAQSSLRHPNVVAVTDVVETRGLPALVMELIEGPALDRLLQDGTLGFEQIDVLARGMLAGMSAAHRHGLIHRDLKPGNILIAVHDRHVVPKVTDFGLAKTVADPDASHEGHTRTGATMGTPAYMAPEQIRDAKNVDARADVFALGAVLYELVTGKRAFQGADSFELLANITAGEHEPVRQVAPHAPERMLAAIEGALQVNVDARWPTVDALLEAWTHDAPPLAATPDEPWHDDLIERIQRATPVASTSRLPSESAGSDDTFALDGTSPSALHHSLPDASAPPTPLPSTASADASSTSSSESIDFAAQHPVAIAAGASAASVPLVMGLLAVMFRDLFTPVTTGGPFMVPVLIAGALACGVGIGLAVHERAGGMRSASWFALPTLVLLLGGSATLWSLNNVQHAIANLQGAQRALLAANGTAVAMITNMTGLALGALALVLSGFAIAWAHRPFEEVGLTRRSLSMLAFGLASGTVLVVANPYLSAVTGGAAPFVPFIALMAVLVATALLGSSESPRVLHARWLLSGLGLLAVVAAAEATEAHGQYRLFREFITLDIIDGLPGAITFVDSMTAPAWPAIASWALAAAVSLGVGLWRTWPPFTARQLLLPLGMVLAFLLSHGATTRQQAETAGVVVPSYLAGAAQWHLGFELTDTPDGLEVNNSPPGSTLQDGDILVAINRTRVRDVHDLLERLSTCRCDKGTCSLAESCLTPGTPLEVELARGSDGRLETRQTPWLGGELPGFVPERSSQDSP